MLNYFQSECLISKTHITIIILSQYYLKYYNHMNADGMDEDMTDAIRGFQRMAGVNETGKLAALNKLYHV